MVRYAGLLILALSASVCQGLPQLQNFITNGNDAYAGQFPYFASISQNLTQEQINCEGAIVDKEWILTSSQCIKLLISALSVNVGQANRNVDGEFVQKRKVEFVIINSDYIGRVIPGMNRIDIALLKLNKPLLLNARVQPINIAKDKCKTSEKVVVSGYGATASDSPSIFPTQLQYANVKVISNGLCRDAIRLVSSVYGDLSYYHVCTGPLSKGITTCLGDLGDPLVRYDINGKPELVGIASWSAVPCGMKGSPTVYVEVSRLDWWIKDRINENFDKPDEED